METASLQIFNAQTKKKISIFIPKFLLFLRSVLPLTVAIAHMATEQLKG